ncbi:MAG: zinc-ribbon domain-containing protein [Syntrophales bacterium]|nr:zinc-ribbon domain-containing protein [Syntrophales bacterium]MDY0043631.1 DUF3426 domain-containing protein [Syntrophales bacterium]
MIIQCPRCKARYRISIEPEPAEEVRYRCTRCGYVFPNEKDGYAENLKKHKAGPVDREENFREIAELMQDINRSSQGFPDFSGKIDEVRNNDSKILQQKKKKTRFVIKILLFLLLMLCAGLIIWINPSLKTSFLSIVTPAINEIGKLTGINQKSADDIRPEKNIVFSNVQESFHMNWIDDHVLVIEGTATNQNNISLAFIRVRGKLLDSAKNIIAQKESYCGNILTEEELRNLRGKEIDEILMTPPDHEKQKEIVSPGGSISFMIAFTDPPKEAGEFIIEPAEVYGVDIIQ